MKKSIIVLFFAGYIHVSAQQDTTQNKPDTISIQQQSISSTPPPANETKKERTTIYKLNPAVDIPLTLVTGGWSGFAFTKIYSKPASSVEEINNLDRQDIPKIDRWAAGMSSDKADANSNILFYGSIPVPFALLLDKKIRKDAGKIGFLYLEAMSITGLFYTGTVYLVDRYRPEAYDTSIPAENRTSGNLKDAFMAGHPALVATSLFFTAKVYGDYNPESSFKYVLYGVAIAGTGTTAYLRHIAGKHFPTDLITGVTIGTLCGILVPHFHKVKNVKESNLGFYPYFNQGAKGLGLKYTFR